MNLEFEQLLNQLASRYPREGELTKIENYSRGLLERLDHVAKIEAAEQALLDSVVRRLRRSHAYLVEHHGASTWDRLRRDQLLVLRYASAAMLQRDPAFIRDKLSLWLKTILFALCDPKPVQEGHRALVEACREQLPADTCRELLPYLELHIRELAHAESEAA